MKTPSPKTFSIFSFPLVNKKEKNNNNDHYLLTSINKYKRYNQRLRKKIGTNNNRN